eukprot:8035507-Prorocentrum_lima.AAC.1
MPSSGTRRQQGGTRALELEPSPSPCPEEICVRRASRGPCICGLCGASSQDSGTEVLKIIFGV